DAVQPGGQWAAAVEGAGLARQYQECGLEGVLGVLDNRQDAPADAEHQRCMSVHQPGEGSLVARLMEALEQFAVGALVRRAAAQASQELLQAQAQGKAGHPSPSERSLLSSTPRPAATKCKFGRNGTRRNADLADSRGSRTGETENGPPVPRVIRE